MEKEMTHITALSLLKGLATTVPIIALSACTTTGNMERNALFGAGLGGLTGAVIGNNTGSGDASTGAAIGGIIGGAGGAYSGYLQDQHIGQTYTPAPGRPLYWDAYYGRYYYTDARTGCTYWQNGQRRS